VSGNKAPIARADVVLLETVDDLDRFEIPERRLSDLLEISQTFASSGRPSPRYIIIRDMA
jgi:hypothetical protein